MYKNSLTTIEDLSTGQIEDILDLAQQIESDRDTFYGLARCRIMASLFLEPSTRTRGSFEAAMKRLGGEVVTVADAKSSSMSKGESLADTIRIWSSYSDLIVIRHPWEGAARLAAEYSDVPVINAGDGSHEHPTQTLLDLYTLRKEFGTLEGRKIVLCGDLKNGRTIHSLIYALLRFGAVIIFVPGEGLGLPDHVVHKIETQYGKPLQKIRHPGLEALYTDGSHTSGDTVDAIYMTPSQPHTLTLFDSARLNLGKDESFALYATRRQGERESSEETGVQQKYPRIDATILNRAEFSKAFILHPLPRVDELSTTIDSDPRSKYFEQAKNGVPVRMALMALMLGLKPWQRGTDQDTTAVTGQPVSSPQKVQCMNPGCVAQQEPESTKQSFMLFSKPTIRLACSYCERETMPAYYAYPTGEVYYPVDTLPRRRPDLSRFYFFTEEPSARTKGLRVPKRGLVGRAPQERS